MIVSAELESASGSGVPSALGRGSFRPVPVLLTGTTVSAAAVAASEGGASTAGTSAGTVTAAALLAEVEAAGEPTGTGTPTSGLIAICAWVSRVWSVKLSDRHTVDTE